MGKHMKVITDLPLYRYRHICINVYTFIRLRLIIDTFRYILCGVYTLKYMLSGISKSFQVLLSIGNFVCFSTIYCMNMYKKRVLRYYNITQLKIKNLQKCNNFERRSMFKNIENERLNVFHKLKHLGFKE